MDKSDVADRIIGYFESQGKTVSATDDLFITEVIDSMQVLDLVLFLESEMGVELDQGQLTVDNFRTVETIAKTVACVS